MTAGDRSARRVDPRLQARRRSVARHQDLRRLWLVVGLTVVASLAIGAIALARSSLLDVEAIEVTGADRSDRRHIATASGIRLGDPLVGIDRQLATARILAVPWVAEAEIRRDWKGVVTIDVVERVGLVALPTGKRFAVVDRTGRQLEIVAERPDGFWLVAGVEASGVPGQPVAEEGEAVVALVGQLTPAIAAVTDRIVVDDGDLQIDLSTGGRANFGDERLLPDKLLALETMLVRVDLRCIETIDVRVPSAPTVRRVPGDATNEEPLSAAGGC